MLSNSASIAKKFKPDDAAEYLHAPSASYSGRAPDAIVARVESAIASGPTDLLGDILEDQSTLLTDYRHISIGEDRKLTVAKEHKKDTKDLFNDDVLVWMKNPLPSQMRELEKEEEERRKEREKVKKAELAAREKEMEEKLKRDKEIMLKKEQQSRNNRGNDGYNSKYRDRRDRYIYRNRDGYRHSRERPRSRTPPPRHVGPGTRDGHSRHYRDNRGHRSDSRHYEKSSKAYHSSEERRKSDKHRSESKSCDKFLFGHARYEGSSSQKSSHSCKTEEVLDARKETPTSAKSESFTSMQFPSNIFSAKTTTNGPTKGSPNLSNSNRSQNTAKESTSLNVAKKTANGSLSPSAAKSSPSAAKSRVSPLANDDFNKKNCLSDTESMKILNKTEVLDKMCADEVPSFNFSKSLDKHPSSLKKKSDLKEDCSYKIASNTKTKDLKSLFGDSDDSSDEKDNPSISLPDKVRKTDNKNLIKSSSKLLKDKELSAEKTDNNLSAQCNGKNGIKKDVKDTQLVSKSDEKVKCDKISSKNNSINSSDQNNAKPTDRKLPSSNGLSFEESLFGCSIAESKRHSTSKFTSKLQKSKADKLHVPSSKDKLLKTKPKESRDSKSHTRDSDRHGHKVASTSHRRIDKLKSLFGSTEDITDSSSSNTPLLLTPKPKESPDSQPSFHLPALSSSSCDYMNSANSLSDELSDGKSIFEISKPRRGSLGINNDSNKPISSPPPVFKVISRQSPLRDATDLSFNPSQEDSPFFPSSISIPSCSLATSFNSFSSQSDAKSESPSNHQRNLSSTTLGVLDSVLEKFSSAEDSSKSKSHSSDSKDKSSRLSDHRKARHGGRHSDHRKEKNSDRHSDHWKEKNSGRHSEHHNEYSSTPGKDEKCDSKRDSTDNTSKKPVSASSNSLTDVNQHRNNMSDAVQELATNAEDPSKDPQKIHQSAKDLQKIHQSAKDPSIPEDVSDASHKQSPSFVKNASEANKAAGMFIFFLWIERLEEIS